MIVSFKHKGLRDFFEANGQLYDGNECLNRIIGILFAETSVVETPVQPKARIEGIKVERKKRRREKLRR